MAGHQEADFDSSAPTTRTANLCSHPVQSSSVALPDQGFRFGNRAGKRYGLEIIGIFAIKLPLLWIIWLLFIQPWTHSAQDAAASVAHMYQTTAARPKS